MHRGESMQKRHSIMVSSPVYLEIKKLKARLLIEKNIEVRNLGQVIEYIVNYYREKEEQNGNKEIS
ncbi:MAG: hypothetical protein QXQ64_03925 [Candidatus Bathyarchaeia archaeon]